jgi:hypothetical protein
MPYFHNDKINLLLIHIPKTGGSSLTCYFSNKYNIFLYDRRLMYRFDKKHMIELDINSSLQHMTYTEIMKRKLFFNINENNLEIITVVRNPYTRIISDLFHYQKINKNTNPIKVYEIIQKYLYDTTLDDHNIPQHLFITNDNKELISNIKILKQETLNEDMINLGYTDFNNTDNANKIKCDYYHYLNSDSIALINTFYDYDFKLFNYDKIIC